MKLIKARIRGTGKLKESEWFELSPRLNLFHFPGEKGAGEAVKFLSFLQTINPTYDLGSGDPFATLPTQYEQNGHIRQIKADKRTVVMGVFNATPSLVQQLVSLGDWFYETDRIEVGRRYDYSRWINFVELSSSTRWSEISADIEQLLDQAGRLGAAPLPNNIDELKPTDRIVDSVQKDLAQWLQKLPPEMQEDSRERITKTATAVSRATQFTTARTVIRARLPLLVTLGTNQELLALDNLLRLISAKSQAADGSPAESGTAFLTELNDQLSTLPLGIAAPQLKQSSTGIALEKDQQRSSVETIGSGPDLLRKLRTKAAIAIAYSRTVCKTEPILLFPAPEQQLPADLREELTEYVIQLSGTCQCLYATNDTTIFPENGPQRHFSAEDTLLLPKSMDEQE